MKNIDLTDLRTSANPKKNQYKKKKSQVGTS